MQNQQNSGATSSFVDRYLPADGAAAVIDPVGQPVPGKTTFDLANIRAILWRQRWILLGVIGIALVLGVLSFLLVTPRYQATAKMRVDAMSGVVLEGQSLSDPYIPSNLLSSYMGLQAEIISSRMMALRVVDDLELDKSEVWLGEQVNSPPASVNPDVFRERLRQQAATRLLGAVSVSVPNDAQFFLINVDSTDPELAARIANSYAQNFVTADIDQSVDANSFARAYLEEQITEVGDRLRQAEMQAIGFARSNRIIGQPLSAAGGSEGGDTASQGTGTAPTLTAANLLQINQRYSDARAQRIAAEQRWQAIARLPADQLPEVQQNGSIQNMRSDIARLQGELADLRQRYQDDYPAIQERLSQINSLERQLVASSNEIKNGIRNQYEIARRQEAGLEVELGRLSNASLDEQDQRVQYNLIDRNVQALRAQLALLTQRSNELQAAANLRSSRVSVLDLATVPRVPFSPDITKNMLVALVLGIAVACLLALVREILDDRLRSIDDLENRLGMPALGQTPFVPDDLDKSLDDRFSLLSEAYSSLRASLDYRLGTGVKVIQFTSSQPSEGKTTCARAVALKYAEIGRRVLLIDMDLRRPGLTKHLGIPSSGTGVVDVLYGHAQLENAVTKQSDPEISVLPVGAIPPNPVEILSSGLVPELLAKAREKFDVIIVDSSPVLGIADAPLLSRYVDAVVLVVEANRANLRGSRYTLRRLNQVGANVIGAVLTKYRALQDGQAYNYSYSYYQYQD